MNFAGSVVLALRPTGIVTMDGVHRPGRIIDGDHQHLLPGRIGFDEWLRRSRAAA